jgi:DNA (cytosine-5)-methyltransferase 1
MKPRLVDAFSGAGGSAKGYQRAGFYVVGIDIAPRPHYCGDEFIQSDALEMLADLDWLAGFDAVHASPPCQGYTQFSNLNAERWGNRVEHPMLIEPVRELLDATGLPYVIENVQGAPLRKDLMLCGSMFGLRVRRHRIFETNWSVGGAPPCHHQDDSIAIYGSMDGRRVWTRKNGTELRAARTIGQASEAMGIDWMTWNEIKEAIPPAYTEFIGKQLLDLL